MADDTISEVYLLHIWIRRISPMIWRRLMVRDESALADLHHTIQIAFGWTDFHLHRFGIHGRNYGVNRVGGLRFSHDARSVRLADFRFRPNEWFLYEYDFGDGWQHMVRVEDRLTMEPRRTYPVCVGGQRAGPPGRLRRPFGVPPAWFGTFGVSIEAPLAEVPAALRAAMRDWFADPMKGPPTRRPWRRSVHDILVCLTGADDPGVRPHRNPEHRVRWLSPFSPPRPLRGRLA
jgi:hypothetical protein